MPEREEPQSTGAGGVMLAQQIVHPDRSAGWQD